MTDVAPDAGELVLSPRPSGSVMSDVNMRDAVPMAADTCTAINRNAALGILPVSDVVEAQSEDGQCVPPARVASVLRVEPKHAPRTVTEVPPDAGALVDLAEI